VEHDTMNQLWRFRWFMRRRKKRFKRSRYLDQYMRKVILESRCPKKLPAILWIFWKQGENAAPDLVKYCIHSWRSRNSGWDVRILDATNVSRFVSMSDVPDSISVQHYADILRLRLLDEQGGVWADATTLCASPLDHWLAPLTQTGFFAFSRPGPDREISNWFLASEPGGVVINHWRRAADAYWKASRKADHYFWQHYLFEWLTVRNSDVHALWATTPRISADGPLLIYRCMREGFNLADLDNRVRINAIPVHKLTWKGTITVSDVQRILGVAG
jgi:mannosyltransferase OCH1-like enzyme